MQIRNTAAGKTTALYSLKNPHPEENANEVRLDHQFVYSLSGKAYARTPPRDRNHVRERRLPFVKRVMSKGHIYHYFVGPGRSPTFRLPKPGAVDFDNAYLKGLAMIEGLEAPDYLAPVHCSVYFIQCGDGGPIKIGIAKRPLSRLETLQTGHHEKLHLRAVTAGGEREERRYHAAFKDFHIRGEWFEPHPDILAEIERLSPHRKDQHQ